MDVLDAAARRAFHDDLARFLRKELPEDTRHTTEDAMRARIEKNELMALENGVETEHGISLWNCLAFALGDEFCKSQEFVEFWSHSKAMPDDKLELIIDGLNATLDGRHWRAAYLFRWMTQPPMNPRRGEHEETD
jgi:hypothetical protein